MCPQEKVRMLDLAFRVLETGMDRFSALKTQQHWPV